MDELLHRGGIPEPAPVAEFDVNGVGHGKLT
jgi:hypothetical protein